MSKKLRTFNQRANPIIKSKKSNRKNQKSSKTRDFKVGQGSPVHHNLNPVNGTIYVDSETGNTYIYVKEIGWIDQSSWQPDIGEGPPQGEMAPENPMTGDQYIDVIQGDFYYYTEGFGWVLGNGSEGPQGPPGREFHFYLTTTMGPTGPTLTQPLKVTPGCQVQLWIDPETQGLKADVSPSQP